MDLFSQIENPINILPRNGMVNYYGLLLTEPTADNYLKYLVTTQRNLASPKNLLGKFRQFVIE